MIINLFKYRKLFSIALFLTFPFIHTSALAESSADGIWSDVTTTTKSTPTDQDIKPNKFRLVTLNKSQFDGVISKAELAGKQTQAPVVFSIPMPDGEFERFEVVETQLMHPDLATKFPEIKTYKGIGYDDRSAWIRFDWTPKGFHGYAKTSKGTVYIDPYTKSTTKDYMSYFRRDFQRDDAEMIQETPPLPLDNEINLTANSTKTVIKTTGSILRTYRIAIAATGEYTLAAGGGTISGAHVAIVTALNRVTGIYENDLAVSFQLIANNDLIIYTNSTTDPYTNNDGFTMLSENQSNIDTVIGNGNYDVGHVFSTGGGGIASLRVPCVTGAKARGVTGLANPTGDPYYVDYVAHELGHQFGANHTFNGNEGSCGGGNRNTATAYEPGSGSTIMGYAGICGSQDVQSSSSTAGGISDDYFHVESIDEMVTYTTVGSGSTCGTTSATGNNAPVADAGTGGFYIPASTPFVLTGNGTDPDGSETLTYTWEQYDLGPAGIPDASTLGPLFRSREGTTNPSRYFPHWNDILSGNNGNMWEVLPAISRDLNFKLTVKDKDNSLAGTGGVDSDQITFHVDGTAGPFQVTQPNSFISIQPAGSLSITWDVAGTSGGNVNCPNVDILLSTDGGDNFATTLVSNTPNDGSETVTLPIVDSYASRILIACSDNIFFDVSDSDFQITNNPKILIAEISSDVPKVIASSSANTITSTLEVTDNIQIADINITNLAGTHTYISDLEFTLISPIGTSVIVMARRCSYEDNFSISLDDEANSPLSAAPCPPTDSDTYQPSNPLSAFDGENAQGTWTLSIEDNYGEDGGSLNSWDLEIEGVSSLPYNCIGSDTVVSNKTFLSGEAVTCYGSNTLSSSGTVTVSGGATIKFISPFNTLTPGFSVQPGSEFSACTGIPCP